LLKYNSNRFALELWLAKREPDRPQHALTLPSPPRPGDGGDQPPDAKAREAMLRGWLADLDGERQAADTLLDQADALLSHLDPAHYLHRDLARYRETRGKDGKGGTMVAAEFTKPA
jgi:hypothetical protein